MKPYIFFILSTFIWSPVYSQTECQQFSSDCEYYSCVEATKHCGKRGYLMGFGDKYCRKFSKKEEKLSREGKTWMIAVRTCLIHRLENVSTGLTCKQYKREAIDQHVPCYTKSGYCDLSKKDKKTIIKIIRGSLWKPSLFSAGLSVLRHCKRQKE
jgi:hypothetical protein